MVTFEGCQTCAHSTNNCLIFLFSSSCCWTNSFLLYYFYYHLVFLYPPPHHPPAITIPLSMTMDSFPFLFNPSKPTFPLALAVLLLSIYESVSILLVSSVCSLDSTNEWNPMIFLFLWLAYVTYHNVLQVHLYCHKGRNVPLFLWLSSIL